MTQSSRWKSGLWPGFFVVFLVPLLGMEDSAATDGYRNHAAVESLLKQWQTSYAEIAQLETIGVSHGGKSIWAMRVAASGEVDPGHRPGVLVAANMAGSHPAGTEAALYFLEQLLTSDADAVKAMRQSRVTYVVPILNPDAHEAFFAQPRQVITGNAGQIDRDRDGLTSEDGPNDLDGDGRITQMRIKDPAGKMIPDPDYPLAMRKADPKEGETGAYRVYSEGFDDDGDGEFNEDGPGGVVPDRNFAHAYEYGEPEAGHWASEADESKAIMDFLLTRRNIGLAVVFGPANNLLAPPKGFGGAVDTGNLKLEIPQFVADILGFDPKEKYTIDEIWERAKTLPMVVQNNLTKEDVAQFLGVGPATKPSDDDLKLIEHFAEKYKKRLEEAGLDNKRKGKQYRKGGFTPWLYYQYGALALELDVWGVPAPPKEEKTEETPKLTLEKLEEMSSEDFVALGEEAIAAFMKENKVPAQFSAGQVINMVSGGQLTPKRIAEMLKRMGAGSGGSGKKKESEAADMARFVTEHAAWAQTPWSEQTLPDGTKVEVGGYDPFIALNPPHALLAKPMDVHAQTILELSENMARVAILKTEIKHLGGDVYRVKATAGNTGFLPTHTGLAKKAKSHLPVRLGLVLPEKVSRLHGPKWAHAETLEGKMGTVEGEWLVRARKGSQITVEVLSDQAGSDRRVITIQQGGN